MSIGFIGKEKKEEIDSSALVIVSSRFWKGVGTAQARQMKD